MASIINFDPIDQGDTWTKTLKLQDSIGNPINLVGCTAHMQFRSYYGVIYADLSSSNNEITLDSTGTVTLSLTPAQTLLFTMRFLYYDFDLTWPNGQKNTLFTGSVTVNLAITKELPILDIDYLSDFSDPVNSLYGFLFNLGAGIQPPPPDPSDTPYADFSIADNSELGFLFNLGAGASPSINPNTPFADFSDLENSGYIAILSLA